MKNSLSNNLLHAWPVHFVLLFTNWFPDQVFFLRTRGNLVKPFLKKCGTDLQICSNVTLYNPSLLSIGNGVRLMNGVVIQAVAEIEIGDNVQIGLRSVITSGDHMRKDGSYRFGETDEQPISIGDGTQIGEQSVIVNGAHIGKMCIIEPQSTVVRGTVPDGSHLKGVPAKPIFNDS